MFAYLNKIFGDFLNFIFAPLLKLGDLASLVIISFILTLLITLCYKWFTDQKLMKSLKDEIKQHQEDMKNHKDNPEKLMEIQKKSMEVNLQYMKHSFKPTLFTFIPLIIFFAWLKDTYVNPILGMNWIWIYIVSSIIFSMVLRKILKIH